ncbi:putative halomucin [Roseburia sp. CAG:309]|nr:putative halomucin [Roseburia sp. CAG:309]
MRRQNYFSNRKIRRRAKKVISIVALAATLVTSIPFATYTDAYAKGQTTLEEMKALSIPTENAITYNLADASLITNKTFMDYYGEKMTVKVIEINITKDGNYVIKGSNEINGELIDTHITVAEGVEANITFDGATIKNQTKYAVCSQRTSIIYNPIFPVIDIFGNANIYVESDSELMSAGAEENPVIRVTGKMTVKDSEAVLKLTPRADEKNPGEGKMVICGNMTGAIQPAGSLTVEGGNLDVTGYIKSIDKFTMTGGKIASTCRYADASTVVLANDITIAGGIWDQNFDAWHGKQSLFEAYRNIQVSGGNIQIRWLQTIPWDVVAFSSPSTHIIGGNLKPGDGFVLEDTLDAYGNETRLFDLTGLPKNADVAEVNGYPVEGIQTTSDGEWKNAALPCCSNLIKMKNGTLYKFDYKYDSENQKGTMVADTENSPVVHDVTLKLTEEDGTPIGKKEIQAVDGFTMKSEYYDGKNYYTYVDDTGKQLSEIRIESSSEFTLKKSSTVTLDGKPFAGEMVPSDSMYMWEKDDYFYGIFYPGDPIPSGNNIVLERVPSVQKNGEWYVKLQSEKDVIQIQNMMQIDNTINVLLDADFDYNKVDTYAPGLLGWTKYYGVFDGNNHTISNVRRSDTGYEVITPQNFGTIKNVHVKNISDKCYDGKHTRQGIVCGDNYGIVENCSVESAVIETMAQKENSNYGKVMEYGALVGGNFGTIRGCFASDITFDGAGVTWPLAHELPYSTIENTYYEAEVESGEIAKTAEQFASGEVCSLLNKGVTDGSQIWYQNIDNDAEQDVAPVADTSHGTVYYGYQGCKTMGYSNTKLPDTPRHKLNYTAEGNVLTGVCTDVSLHTVTMTLTAEDATYDGKEHKAVLNKTYSDTWKEADTDVDAKIIYTRDGKPTTDLTSTGTIKASVTMGDAAAEVMYMIKAVPTPTAAPAVSSAPTPAATPSVTPAGTNPGSTPSANPSEGNKSTATQAPSDKPVIAPGETKAPAAAKAPETTGTKIASKKGDTYKVTDTSGKIPEVELTKSAAKKKAKTVVIPKTVKVDGVNYKVTAIAEKAFAGNKKLKTVVIGADIKKIGAKAFYKCVNLKKVTIQTTKLKAKSVGAKAFAKIHKKAVVKVPKEKKKAYKKWLKKRGIGGKQKIVTD